MAEHYKFFDSIDGEDERSYTADEFAEYFRQVISSGILNGGTNLQVVCSGTDMDVQIKEGYAWLEGYLYKIDVEPLAFTLDAAHPTQDRIDRVVIRLDKRLEHRYVKAFILKGTPAGNPTVPAITRDENTYEISLAQVKVIGGKSFVAQSEITDERLNTIVCGLANSLVTADTTDIYNQFQDWYNSKTVQWQQEWNDWWVLHPDQYDNDWETWRANAEQRFENWFTNQQTEGFVMANEKGQPGGIPTLDADAKVPHEQLPALDFAPLNDDGVVEAKYLLGDYLKSYPVGQGVTTEKDKLYNIDGSGKLVPIDKTWAVTNVFPNRLNTDNAGATIGLSNGKFVYFRHSSSTSGSLRYLNYIYYELDTDEGIKIIYSGSVPVETEDYSSTERPRVGLFHNGSVIFVVYIRTVSSTYYAQMLTFTWNATNISYRSKVLDVPCTYSIRAILKTANDQCLLIAHHMYDYSTYISLVNISSSGSIQIQDNPFVNANKYFGQQLYMSDTFPLTIYLENSAGYLLYRPGSNDPDYQAGSGRTVILRCVKSSSSEISVNKSFVEDNALTTAIYGADNSIVVTIGSSEILIGYNGKIFRFVPTGVTLTFSSHNLGNNGLTGIFVNQGVKKGVWVTTSEIKIFDIVTPTSSSVDVQNIQTIKPFASLSGFSGQPSVGQSTFQYDDAKETLTFSDAKGTQIIIGKVYPLSDAVICKEDGKVAGQTCRCSLGSIKSYPIGNQSLQIGGIYYLRADTMQISPEPSGLQDFFLGRYLGNNTFRSIEKGSYKALQSFSFSNSQKTHFIYRVHVGFLASRGEIRARNNIISNNPYMTIFGRDIKELQRSYYHYYDYPVDYLTTGDLTVPNIFPPNAPLIRINGEYIEFFIAGSNNFSFAGILEVE